LAEKNSCSFPVGDIEFGAAENTPIAIMRDIKVMSNASTN